MRILAIDTTLSVCAAAVLVDDVALAVRVEPMERGHAERLAPLVAETVAEAGLRPTDFDRIAVTTGPGSFTGVRVGLAFARGLALAIGRPCVGVSTLEALACGSGTDGVRAAAIGAPLGGIYAAAYCNGATLLAPGRTTAESVTGADWFAAARWIGPSSDAVPAADFHECAAPDIVGLARLAARVVPAAYPPNPLYLRDPDAKPFAGP